jgi:hypothetical protein
MSSPDTPKAIVESCVLLPDSDEVTPGIKITVYHVEARMLVPANKFSDDVYIVRITKPEGIGDLMDDEGTLMEHGRFSFDSTQEAPKDTELEVEITEIGDSFSYRGQQVRIGIIYPHEDTPSQAQYAFFINSEQRGAAYLKEHAVQQARTFIDKNL